MQPVIDLDRDWSPPGDSRGVRRPRRSPRPIALVVAFAVALLCTASAPLTPTLEQLFTVPIQLHATTAFTDGRVYVAETTRQQTVDLRAYRLPTGEPLWSVTLPGTDGAWVVTQVPGVGVVSTEDTFAGGGSHLTGVDADTGRILWQADVRALTFDASAGRVLTVGDVDSATPVALTSVDARTGAVAWSASFPPMSHWTVGTPADNGRITFLSPDGVLSTRSTRTGAPLATLSTGLDRSAVSEAQILEARGRLMLGYPAGSGRTVLAAYDPVTLAEQWRVDFPAADSPYLAGASDCDPYLCVLDDGAMVALDPDTGASVWSAKGWTWAETYHGWVLAGTAGPSQPRWALLDPRTGTPVLDLTGWDVSGGDIVTRPGDPAWLARLDPAAPRLRPLEPLPGGWNPGCAGYANYVACAVGPVLRVFRDNSAR